MNTLIEVKGLVGDFAENKDVAKELRIKKIIPTLRDGKEVVLDFSGVSGATQSFIHALISEPIRLFRDVALEKIHYKNCSDVVKEVIKTVSEYMQESLDSENYEE
ncbi:STAS-like domain-containing protein [Patescibacteria group bacterium]|nr:STAS-like domain-containing protein [Patescibacteria group bacterium]MBU4078143.1 STAS-like domain-containing protein [Patescibacteria group bacterium]